MENTSPKKLRAKLKDYLDLAKKEVIRIKRRSGQNYVLMTEDKYAELKAELASLQKRLLGKGHVVEKVKPSKVKAKNKKADKKAEKRADKKEKKNKNKKSNNKKVTKKAAKKVSKKKAKA